MCRQEVGEVLKQLGDVSLQSEDEKVRTSLRMRIDAWAEALSAVADADRQKRQTAGGNELGGIFGEIANAEVCFKGYSDDNIMPVSLGARVTARLLSEVTRNSCKGTLLLIALILVFAYCFSSSACVCWGMGVEGGAGVCVCHSVCVCV